MFLCDYSTKKYFPTPVKQSELEFKGRITYYFSMKCNI